MGVPVDVQVDPNVELVSIVFRLAGIEAYRQAPATAYRTAVDGHFSRFIDDPAVAMAQALHAEHSIGYNAPADLAVHLSAGVALNGAERLDRRWDDAPSKPFVKALARFRERTYFDSFLSQQAASTGAVEEAWRAWLASHDVGGWFTQRVVATEPVSWTVVPGLLVGPHNYGCSVRMDDGSLRLTPVLGVADVDGEVPRLGGETEAVLVHELAHGFVNAAFDAVPALDGPAQRVYATAEGQMKAQAYGEARIALNEAGVRALTVVYMGEVYGPIARQKQLEREIARGFAWLEPMVAVFEAARAAGPLDVAATAPAIAAALDAWDPASVDHTFRGPINAGIGARTRYGAAMKLLAPASGPLAAYADAMYTKFYAKSLVERVDGATWAPPGPTPFVAYGTPTDTPALAAVLAAIGAEVAADHITLPGGLSYAGEHLALIAALPDRADPTVPIVLYTSAAAEDAVDLNAAFHGPTDWLVLRKLGPEHFAPLASGEFFVTAAGIEAVADALPSVRPMGTGK